MNEENIRLCNSISNRSLEIQSVIFTYLLISAYLGISLATTEHYTLFVGKSFTLPLINATVDLPLFYVVASIILVLVHGYMIYKYISLIDVTLVLSSSLRLDESTDRRRAVWDLPSSPMLPLLFPNHHSHFETSVPFLFNFAILFVLPIALLLLFMFAFLPYQSQSITFLHFALLLVDLILVAGVWRRGRAVGDASPAHRRSSPAGRLATAVLPAMIVATVTTVGLSLIVDQRPPLLDPVLSWFPDTSAYRFSKLELRGVRLV
jgi:hypothetical protein